MIAANDPKNMRILSLGVAKRKSFENGTRVGGFYSVVDESV